MKQKDTVEVKVEDSKYCKTTPIDFRSIVPERGVADGIYLDQKLMIAVVLGLFAVSFFLVVL